MTITKKVVKQSMRHLSIVMVCLAAIGCALASERRHPDHRAYLPHIRDVLCVFPEITVFTEKNSSLIRQDMQSRTASLQIRQALAQTLSAKGYDITVADGRIMDQPDVRSLVALFRSVNRSIQLHTYGPQIFPSKQDYFDYALGSVSDLLDAVGADALVLAIGQQTASQTDPKTWVSIAMVEPPGTYRMVCFGGG